MVTQCCQCRKVREDDVWVTPEEPLPVGELVIHGYCPSCAAQLMREIKAHRPNHNRAFAPASD